MLPSARESSKDEFQAVEQLRDKKRFVRQIIDVAQEWRSSADLRQDGEREWRVVPSESNAGQ